MKAVMKRRLAITVILTLWAVSTGWLVFREAYPEIMAVASTGRYRSFFSRGVMIMDQWMKITFQGRQIGYSHTGVDAVEGPAGRQYQIGNRTLLQMNVMGAAQRIAVHAQATVDALYHLQKFSFVLSATGYALTIEGKRARGNTFDCTVRGPDSSRRLSVTIPEDAILYSPMTELSLKALVPGRHVTLRMFNPMTLTSQNITIKSLRREPLQHAGSNVLATVLSANLEGMETLSWVDGEGNLLRQETLFGWAMEACKPDEALAANSLAPAGDMLAQLAVPVTGPADRLSAARSARLRLSGAPLQPEWLRTHRQTVVSTGQVTEVIVRAESLPASGLPPASALPDMKAALAPSAFIQSEDPRLAERARTITGEWTNSLAAAMAIYTWVFENVEKQPTVSLPSALDVLLRPRGDCNEHTYLFVGLARAAGIPAVIRVGLTFQNGSFYYHAWPSVYVGQWLDMDPTLGKPAVGADHLSLFEGELSEQMKLMGVLGRLKVEVVDTEN